jgi:hypothetical protein
VRQRLKFLRVAAAEELPLYLEQLFPNSLRTLFLMKKAVKIFRPV